MPNDELIIAVNNEASVNAFIADSFFSVFIYNYQTSIKFFRQ